MLILNRTFLDLYLVYRKIKEKASEKPKDEKIYYKELDLLEGIDEEEYNIVFGAENGDLEEEA
jgi:hypothetical protein